MVLHYRAIARELLAGELHFTLNLGQGFAHFAFGFSVFVHQAGDVVPSIGENHILKVKQPEGRDYL